MPARDVTAIHPNPLCPTMRTVWFGLVLGLAAGCTEQNAFVPPPPPDVTVATPERETITTYVEYTGKTVPAETVDVRARVTGVLESIHFEDSADVERGDPLFTIEKETYQAAVAGAEAKLQEAQANLGIAQVTLERVTVAFEKNAATEVEVKKAEADRDAAQAAVSVAVAALSRAQIDLDYTEISAPIAGRVSRHLVSVGNVVSPTGESLLTSIVDNDPMYAYFAISERDVLMYQQMKRDLGVERAVLEAALELTDGTRHGEIGVVDFADNRIDARTGTVQARARFDNPGAFLVGGLFVRVLIPRLPREAVLIPELAIQRDMVGAFVLVVDAENKVDRRDIEVAERLGRRREVASGLDGTERVVVIGLQRCRPGVEVNVTGTYEVTEPLESVPVAPSPESAEATSAGPVN